MTEPSDFRESLPRKVGIFQSPGNAEVDTAYRDLWDQEATSDAVYSATGLVSQGKEDFATLTANHQPLWLDFPAGHHSTILEVGCGYGRVPMLLTGLRGVTCDRYIGVDISQIMLERFARYRSSIPIFSGAEVDLVRASIEEVSLPSCSVDLVISSSVFLHMGKDYVSSALAMLARVIKPGGGIVFDCSFPNSAAFASVPVRLYGAFAPAKSNRAKYYTRQSIETLLDTSGLLEKVPDLVVFPSIFAALPVSIRGHRVPFAQAINRVVSPPPRLLIDRFATMFSVYSKGLYGET